MEKIGIIEKVEKSTVNALIVLKNPNRNRICLDPCQKNQAIKRKLTLSTTRPTTDEKIVQDEGLQFKT